MCQKNSFYVTPLPCKLLITTLFMFTCIKQSTFYFDSNKYYCQNCRNFMKIILKESYLMNITYLQVTGRPSCGQEIIAIGAVDAIDVKHWGCEPQSWESITYFSICQKFINSLRFGITAWQCVQIMA